MVVADDTAPSSSDSNVRKAISQFQVLLYAAEDEGKQLHIDFGADKCQLLITAKPGKMRQTFDILKSEPDSLTFYGQPVTVIQPGEHYIHLGVPQAPVKQSKIAVEYRSQKGMDMAYSLQSTTKNALMGINPVNNKFMINCYIIHGFTYGLDTIDINPSDLDLLETKFRSVLRSMQSLSPSTAGPAIYLMAGVLPAVADRDIQIMRLVGQLAICSRDLQYVSDIVEGNLSKYGISFPGWSGVARRAAALYGLPDPLELFEQPWTSKGFSEFAKQTITKYWASHLQKCAATYESLDLLDTSRLDLTSAHPIWVTAGSNSISVPRATIVT